MADYFYGRILIGGLIPWDKAEQLLTLLKQEHDAPEDVTVATLGDSPLALQIAIDGCLEIEDSDAAYGQFAKLEKFLAENRIAFDRESGAKHEFNAELVQYRPGQFDDKPVVTELDANGRAVVHNDDVYEVYKYLLSNGDGPCMTSDDATELIHGSCTMLEKILGPDVPELDLFTIVEEEH
jgi:hypothetical protein